MHVRCAGGDLCFIDALGKLRERLANKGQGFGVARHALEAFLCAVECLLDPVQPDEGLDSPLVRPHAPSYFQGSPERREGEIKDLAPQVQKALSEMSLWVAGVLRCARQSVVGCKRPAFP